MTGSALGFSFLTLISVIMLALSLMGVSIFWFNGLNSSEESLYSIAFIAMLVFCAILNAVIVYGLRQKSIWATYLAGVEIVALLSVIFANLWMNETSSLLSSLIPILILGSILIAVIQDHSDFKRIKQARTS